MDPTQYQQYADFYWHNYTESAALPWDYPPPMRQTPTATLVTVAAAFQEQGLGVRTRKKLS